MKEVSVVVPTRNRPVHLEQLLESLSSQIFGISEILIVDASDDKSYQTVLDKKFSSLPLRWVASAPSVCEQRNIGIRQSRNEWILLCDDDIRLPPEYLSTLVQYTDQNPLCGAVAGRLRQQEGETWVDQYPVRHFGDLLWRFVFLQSIWGDISSVKVPGLFKPFDYLIRKFYRKAGNTQTAAGWPLITDWGREVFQTRFYSLGANLIRKTWLLQSPYDEVLEQNGIGDNYGVAMGFPGSTCIHVLDSTFAWHHRATENRPDPSVSHFKRVKALHYFLKKDGASLFTNLALLWSLLGHLIFWIAKGNASMMGSNLKAIKIILLGQNPYWKAHLRKTLPPPST